MSNKIAWRPNVMPGSVDSYTGETLSSGVVVHVCTKCRRVVTAQTQKDLGLNRCFGCDNEVATLTMP